MSILNRTSMNIFNVINKSITLDCGGYKEEIKITITLATGYHNNENTLITVGNILCDIEFDTYKVDMINFYQTVTKLRAKEYIFTDDEEDIGIYIIADYYYKDKGDFVNHIISQIYKKNKLGNILVFSESIFHKYIEYVNKDLVIKLIRVCQNNILYDSRYIISDIFDYSPIPYLKSLIKNNRELFSNIDYGDCLYINSRLFYRDQEEFVNFFKEDLIIVNKIISDKGYIQPWDDIGGRKLFKFVIRMVYFSNHMKDYKHNFSSIIKLIE